MSKITIGTNTGNQLFIKTDVSKIFVWENRYEKGNYVNDIYDTINLPGGLLMGRVATTQKLVPLASNAVDGSQYPVGILAEDTSIEEGDEKELTICNYGDVIENLVVLAHGGDTMNTVISGRSIRDRIAGDTVGIRLMPSSENTIDDNE